MADGKEYRPTANGSRVQSPFRVYDLDECGADGYPVAWHNLGNGEGVKHLVRAEAGHRCVRCLHPFRCGETPGTWSPCDERCAHQGPVRYRHGDDDHWHESDTMQPAGQYAYDATRTAIDPMSGISLPPIEIQARARVLTVHHLRLGNDAKRDLRWWNLAALCQRCHLQIQGKVQMERIWPHEHSEWFKPASIPSR